MHHIRTFINDDEGQNLVEFALLLPLLMYILMGTIQFGLIFNAYITLNNAVREGARWGSIYIYNNTLSKAQNDAARNNGVLDRIISSRGVLNMGTARGSGTANFAHSANFSGSSPTYTNGDTVITYTVPTGYSDTDPRKGQYMAVSSSYHIQIFVPLLDQFLPDDPDKTGETSKWLRLPGQVTVVIN